MDDAQVSKRNTVKRVSDQRKLEPYHAAKRSAKGYDRRTFFGHVSKLTAASIAVGSIGLQPLLQGCNESAEGQELTCEIGPQDGS